MRLNKHGKPYQDPLQWIRKCRIKSPSGLIYHPIKAPEGLCNCGIMLELKPKIEDHIFPSTSRAYHAISHTLKFLKQSGVELEVKEFIVEKV